MAIKARAILDQFDLCAKNFTFPMLDNGYVYLGTVRLSAYRDFQDWLVIIEVVGANIRAGSHNSIQNCLHLFGSDLHRPPGTANEDFLSITRDVPQHPVFDESIDWILRPSADRIQIRDKEVRFETSQAILKAKGIIPDRKGNLHAGDLIRLLLPEYRNDLLATEAELLERNPHHLPLFLRLEEWHHPDLAGGEIPSESHTFQMLVKTLESDDPATYVPLKPNTDWYNWPESGTL